MPDQYDLNAEIDENFDNSDPGSPVASCPGSIAGNFLAGAAEGFGTSLVAGVVLDFLAVAAWPVAVAVGLYLAFKGVEAVADIVANRDKYTSEQWARLAGNLVGGGAAGAVGLRLGAASGAKALPLHDPNPAALLKNGFVDHGEVQTWARTGNLTDQWAPSQKFNSGGYRYQTSDGQFDYSIHGHGANQSAPAGSNSAAGPTTSVARTPSGNGGPTEYLRSDGQWTAFKGNENAVHIPLVNSPY